MKIKIDNKIKEERLGLIEIFIASLLFGILPILIRTGKNIGTFNLSFFRVLVAAISIYLFVIFTKKKIMPFKHEKVKLLVFGGLHGFIIIGFFVAIKYLSVALAVLLLYSSSIWMVVFSIFWLKEKLQRNTIIAMVISIIGLILILIPKQNDLNMNIIGIISGLFAGAGMGIVYVLSKTFKKYDKVSLTFWQNLIAIPFLLPLFLIDFPKFQVYDIFLLLILGSVFTAVPFLLIYNGLKKVNTQKASIVIMLDIVFSVIFAFFIFKEIPGINVIIGGILIMIGSYIITRN